MLQGDLSGYGRLLMQGAFSVWADHKRDIIRDLRYKTMLRHLFLYEKAILFCKKKDDENNPENATYQFKNVLQVIIIYNEYRCCVMTFLLIQTF